MPNSFGNPFAIPQVQMTGLKNIPQFGAGAGLATLLKSQQAILQQQAMQARIAAMRARAAGGAGAAAQTNRFTDIRELPKANGTKEQIPVVGATRQERDAKYNAELQKRQQAIIDSDPELTKLRDGFGSKSLPGQKEILDKMRQDVAPRLSRVLGIPGEELTKSLTKGFQSQYDERQKEVNSADFLGLGTLARTVKNIGNTFTGALSAIGKSADERLALGNAMRDERKANQSAYEDEIQRLQAEGKSTAALRLSNPFKAINEFGEPVIGTVLPALAGGAVGSLAGPGGALAGASIGGGLAGAAYGGGAALEQVASDPDLDERQRRESIDSAYGLGAAISGGIGAFPIGPVGALRAGLRNAAVNRAATAAAEKGGLAAISPTVARAEGIEQVAKNIATQSAARRIGTNLGTNMADMAALNSAFVLANNAGYNAATGLNRPVTEGLEESIYSGAGLGALFGIPGIMRLRNRYGSFGGKDIQTLQEAQPVRDAFGNTIEQYSVPPNYLDLGLLKQQATNKKGKTKKQATPTDPQDIQPEQQTVQPEQAASSGEQTTASRLITMQDVLRLSPQNLIRATAAKDFPGFDSWETSVAATIKQATTKNKLQTSLKEIYESAQTTGPETLAAVNRALDALNVPSSQNKNGAYKSWKRETNRLVWEEYNKQAPGQEPPVQNQRQNSSAQQEGQQPQTPASQPNSALEVLINNAKDIEELRIALVNELDNGALSLGDINDALANLKIPMERTSDGKYVAWQREAVDLALNDYNKIILARQALLDEAENVNRNGKSTGSGSGADTSLEPTGQQGKGGTAPENISNDSQPPASPAPTAEPTANVNVEKLAGGDTAVEERGYDGKKPFDTGEAKEDVTTAGKQGDGRTTEPDGKSNLESAANKPTEPGAGDGSTESPAGAGASGGSDAANAGGADNIKPEKKSRNKKIVDELKQNEPSNIGQPKQNRQEKGLSIDKPYKRTKNGVVIYTPRTFEEAAELTTKLNKALANGKLEWAEVQAHVHNMQSNDPVVRQTMFDYIGEQDSRVENVPTAPLAEQRIEDGLTPESQKILDNLSDKEKTLLDRLINIRTKNNNAQEAKIKTYLEHSAGPVATTRALINAIPDNELVGKGSPFPKDAPNTARDKAMELLVRQGLSEEGYAKSLTVREKKIVNQLGVEPPAFNPKELEAIQRQIETSQADITVQDAIMADDVKARADILKRLCR